MNAALDDDFDLSSDDDFEPEAVDGLILPGELSKHQVVGDDDEPLPFDVEFDLAVLENTPDNPTEDVLGANLAATPAYTGALAARAAKGQALLATRQSRPQQRQLDFPISGAFGPVGGRTTITIRPQCIFRVEKFMVTDTVGGLGTSIVQIAIGQKIQRPGNTPQGTLSQFFAEVAHANGITLDTAHPWEDIAITVAFNQACTFYGNLFGTADID